MNKAMLLLMLSACPVLISAQLNFELKGKVGHLNAPAKVYLRYADGEKMVLDSTSIIDGVFSFKGAVSEITVASLILDHSGVGFNQLNPATADYTSVYLSNETMTLESKDSIKGGAINGSPLNAELVKYLTLLNKGMTKMNALSAEFAGKTPQQQADSAYQKELTKKVAEANDEIAEVKKNYIRQNPTSYLSLQALSELVNEKRPVVTLDSFYNNLSPSLRSGKQGLQLAKSLDILRNTSTGKSAPIFSQPDKSGKPVSLTDFKGKYVLIDFWASWCGPCRQENPNVVKAYTKYHPKGFEIIGISLDDADRKNAWLKAIQDDGLVWAQLSDLKGWQNEAAQLYGITSIPQNYLLSPTCKIIAVNLRGEELDKKLKELFK